MECLDIFRTAEVLHRQFLDVLQHCLDKNGIRDINAVRASILLSIGKAEMSVSELMYTGCYLGSNVSYNLKSLTESGYIDQVRSAHDRRVTMVKNSRKALALCEYLKETIDRYSEAATRDSVPERDLDATRRTLGTLQKVWRRAVEPAPFGDTALLQGAGSFRQPADIETHHRHAA